MKGKLLVASTMLAVLALAGCGGKANDSKAPASGTPAVTTPAPSTPANTAPAAKGDKYTVVAADSSTAYNVRETFLGKDLKVTAVGKTSTMTGDIYLDGGVIQPSTIQVDVSTLTSDESKRDNKVRSALDVTTHKYAIFKITGAEGNPVLKDGQETAIKLKGNMTIKGTEKPLTFEGTAKLSGDTVALNVSSTFKMTDFGVSPPNIAGFVAVVDEVKLDVTYMGKKQ